MSEPPSDPPDAARLFSPAVETHREPSSDAPFPADSSLSTDEDRPPSAQSIHRQALCRVELPRLSRSQKAKYRGVAEYHLLSEEEFDHDGVDRVVGEVREGKQRSFYVRYEDGIIHKVLASSFKKSFADKIDEYELARQHDTLPPFDPSSHLVHPASRQEHLTVTPPRKGRTRAGRSRNSTDDSTSEEMSDGYMEDSDAVAQRRSTRTAAAVANKKLGSDLPFSPKKTRATQRAIVIHDTDSDSEVQETQAPTRKSTRSRVTRRANLDDEDFEDFSDASAPVARNSKQKKPIRGKASRPAYGNFRVVADLQLDEDENEDIAPLLAHRSICEKCHTPPTHEQAKSKKGRKRKPREDDFEEDEETRLANLGGWVRCLKCPVSAHWGCLAKTQRDEILRAAHERDKAECIKSGLPPPAKRIALDSYQTTEFICGACMKGGICMGCKEVALKADQSVDRTQSVPAQGENDQGTSLSAPEPTTGAVPEDDPTPHELLFRCFVCKRLAHYAHLPVPDGYDTSLAEIASYYQSELGWRCSDCSSYVYTVEHILSWRPYPADAVEPPRAADELPNHKSMLPREYLVKWVDRSYRRVQWVPHGWLLALAPTKLKNFIQGGTKVPLLPEPVSDQEPVVNGPEDPIFEIGRDDTDGVQPRESKEDKPQLVADPDAERRIPPGWRTVDRVLDIRLWRPVKAEKGKGRRVRVESSDEEDGLSALNPDHVKLRDMAFDEGEEPPSEAMVTIDEYESLMRRKLTEMDARRVAWALLKWDDLGYDDASWDSPPRSKEGTYAAYENAFRRFLFARTVTVPARNKKGQLPKDSSTGKAKYRFTVESQPQLGQDPQFKLMPFQIEGVNWLCHNWKRNQNSILADEMGLGKTVQIVTFVGTVIATSKAFPVLVVVPNSTITNWVREFERWAPKLRVVPFYGEAKAREIIKRYELNHSHPALGTTGAKYHVLVTTYEMITNTKEFTPVFKNTPRWEMLIVDEGQRLKNDESLGFKRLRELNTFHRIIMTGTPLNNNIRELFNLMSFLDPDEWTDLEALSKQYEVLTDDLVKDLHVRLKPYFLRRIKSEVLQLPPKNEVIVPVSMAPLQKEIYRSILSQNLEILRRLAEGNTTSAKSGSTVTKTNMNNMLMQLRKCLQHPYLVSPDIEPKGLPEQEIHERLVAASAKLRLLRLMLPKLHSRGHRVLLFSQFAIALDIVQDFLVGEGIKFFRLDGETKQAKRQKDMDEFNKPDSDVSIYLLTTRAGGVGINLWSADTVIIFDPDFNPHQDLQAIARSHRYGQKKTVLVFKLMVKDSAEERIMQTGKKKLVLDHLIVQNMDDEDGTKEDVQSILMFGAKALFEEQADNDARDIHYSENDIDNLIEKTEKEGDQIEPESGTGTAASLFAFAKVWSADKDALEDLAEEQAETEDAVDSWTRALELIAARKATEQQNEATGRGVRRKAAAVFPQQTFSFGDSPNKDKEKANSRKRKKSKGKSAGSDDSDFHAPVSDPGSDSDNNNDDLMDVDEIQMLPALHMSPSSELPQIPKKQVKRKHKHRQPDLPHRSLSPSRDQQGETAARTEFCGLCGKRHKQGNCSMTESPENLAQYRLMLMQHAGDETIEERRAAIRVIDETLHRLGKTHLIYGQPLRLIEQPSQSTASQLPKRPKLDSPDLRQVQAQTPLIGSRAVTNVSQPVAGPSRMNGTSSMAGPLATAAPLPAATPRISKPVIVNAAAGPSDRATKHGDNSTDMPQVRKTSSVVGGQYCPICGRVPIHLAKDCPVVAQGQPGITAAIERLSRNPAQAPVVDALKGILRKLQRRALAASRATTHQSIIDLSQS